MKQKLYHFICLFLPIRKRIVFESNPEFSCNTLPVYKEMMRRGIDKEYEIYWLVEDKKKYKDDKSGIKYLNYWEKGIGILKIMYILATSKVLIFSNRFMTKYKKEQLVINLLHGSPLKKTDGYVEYDTCDYVITQSTFFNKIVSDSLQVPIEKMVALGFPRTDILVGNTGVLNALGVHRNQKVMVWMPTFRKNKNTDVEFGSLNTLGVPLLDSGEKFEQLNKRLEESNVLLIIKLHPVEDTSNMLLSEYTNIWFLNDADLEKKGVTVYGLLAESDALLTDYSSVYYDYLLTDKPIGLVVDDLAEYGKRNGFFYGEYKDFVKGSYIECLDDFFAFIYNIEHNIDPDKEERQWAKERYCEYQDFKSTNRVVDFIIEKLNKK